MRLPDDTQRLTIYGQTGSGKTLVGLWHLLKRRTDARPWIVWDFKRDPTIAQIPRLPEIELGEVPRHPGLYVVRPHPAQRAQVEQAMWRIWEREVVGNFADEGFMVASLQRPNAAWEALCTQGRAKRIPLITCTQRPAWLSPFTMSESDFHQVLHVEHPEDVKRLSRWLPNVPFPTERNFCSWYREVATGEVEYLAPVPDKDELLNRFDKKMPRRVNTFRGFLGNERSTVRR